MGIRRHHSVEELVTLYKSRVLSTIEYRTAAIYHACAYKLAKLDKVQQTFLNELGITTAEALLDFNLAPLKIRRDLSMLGLIHKTCLGLAPRQFNCFFVKQDVPPSVETRSAARRHRFHLKVPELRLEIARRSALGLIAIYNGLPADAVDKDSVSGFQRVWQNLVASRCKSGFEGWEDTFSPRVQWWRRPFR